MSAVDTAKAAYDKAVADRAAALADVEALLAAEATVTAAYDTDANEKTELAVTKAVVRRQRAERILARYADTLTQAGVDLNAALHADKIETLQQATAAAASWTTAVVPELKELVALDVQLTAIVDRIADKIVAADESYRSAVSLASELQRVSSLQLAARPVTLADAKYLAQVVLGVRRGDETNGWMEGRLAPDWKDTDREKYEAMKTLAAEVLR